MKNYTAEQIASSLEIYRKPTVTEWIIGIVILVIAPIVMLVVAK